MSPGSATRARQARRELHQIVARITQVAINAEPGNQTDPHLSDDQRVVHDVATDVYACIWKTDQTWAGRAVSL